MRCGTACAPSTTFSSDPEVESRAHRLHGEQRRRHPDFATASVSDDRVKAASPSCYITSFTRLIETIGVQDAEQNVFGQLAFGMDHADYLMARAPTPVLLCAATERLLRHPGNLGHLSTRQAPLHTDWVSPSASISSRMISATTTIATPGRPRYAGCCAGWMIAMNLIVEGDIQTLTDVELRCTPQWSRPCCIDEAPDRCTTSTARTKRGTRASAARELWASDSAGER